MNIAVAEMYHSVVKLMAPLTSEGTYATIVNEARKLSRAKYGSIFLLQNNRLVRAYSTEPERLQIPPRARGFTFKALLSRKPLVLPVRKLAQAHPEYKNTRITKVIFVPLTYDQDLLGIITLDSVDERKFTARQLQILQLFGSLVSLKLRNDVLFAEVKEALETRDLFISMASHELKTPLTTISAYAQLIEKHLEQNKPVKTEWAVTLKSATNRMTRLINELLHVNQIRTGKMTYKFQPYRPLDVIKQAVTDFQMSYPKHSLLFEDKRDKKSRQILIDSDKMTQVIINVLNNAGKFSPADKPLELKVSADKTHLFISIKDRGPGIPLDDQSNLFQEFHKAKNHQTEGMGLGLFISKKIIEAHRGAIELKSEPGLGTEVVITLPYVIND